MCAVKRYRLIKTIARWALAAMLFTQGTLVANACLRVDASPLASFSKAEMVDCEMAAANPKTCFNQYLDQTDQIGAQSPFATPAVSSVTLVIGAEPEPLIKARAALTPRGRGPPIPIRYCSLLI
jgi:hypothetical protein